MRHRRNRKLRIKLTDWCNLTCPFCHSEGAAGAVDLSPTDQTLLMALRELRSHFDWVHLTGGEPTSYPHLPEIIDVLRGLDYHVAITSNGLFKGAALRGTLQKCDYVNISFHTLQPSYFESFVRSVASSPRVIDVVRDNIDLLRNVLPLRINTVVTGSDDVQQLASLHEFAESRAIPLKLVPDWRTQENSKRFILKYLREHGYTAREAIKISPGSNVRIIFSHDQRGDVEFKTIDPFRPDFLCDGCTIVDQCVEAFSFVRVEGCPAQFRLCILKPPLDAPSFVRSFERHLKPLLEEPVDSWHTGSMPFSEADDAVGVMGGSSKTWDVSVAEVVRSSGTNRISQ